MFFPSVEYLKLKILKSIPSKSAATIDGVRFQESRDLGDLATSAVAGPNANGTNIISQSMSDSKLTVNASGIDNSKTNIIDVDSGKTSNGINGSSNGNKKMMLNGKQRSNTIANGLQPNGNASSELVAGKFR